MSNLFVKYGIEFDMDDVGIWKSRRVRWWDEGLDRALSKVR